MYAIFDILSEVSQAYHRHNFATLEQIIIQQVLRVAHQQLATIIDHATHLSRLLIESVRLFDQSLRKANYSIDGHDHVVADGGLVLLHDTSSLILDVEFFLG